MKMCEEGLLDVRWLFFCIKRPHYYWAFVASHTSAVVVASAKSGETFLVLQQLESCDRLFFFICFFSVCIMLTIDS